MASIFASVELTADAAVALAFGSRMYDIPRSLWLPAALILVVTWTLGIGLGPRTRR